MAAVADLNGDGVTDLIAGVPHHIAGTDVDEEKVNAGEAFVFSGKDGLVLFTLSDPTAEEDGKMSAAVAGLGDVNGDGVPDLAVGVPGKDIGGEDGIPNVGLVYLFSGQTGALIRTLNHPDRGGAEAGAAFGSALADAGDVDGDGATFSSARREKVMFSSLVAKPAICSSTSRALSPRTFIRLAQRWRAEKISTAMENLTSSSGHRTWKDCVGPPTFSMGAMAVSNASCSPRNARPLQNLALPFVSPTISPVIVALMWRSARRGRM